MRSLRTEKQQKQLIIGAKYTIWSIIAIGRSHSALQIARQLKCFKWVKYEYEASVYKNKMIQYSDIHIILAFDTDVYLYVLWFVGQLFRLTAGSSPPLLQSSMSIVGWRWAFRYLGGGWLLAWRPLIANNDHGVPVIGTLILRLLQHHHALRVLLTQCVQRNHWTGRHIDEM